MDAPHLAPPAAPRAKPSGGPGIPPNLGLDIALLAHHGQGKVKAPRLSRLTLVRAQWRADQRQKPPQNPAGVVGRKSEQSETRCAKQHRQEIQALPK